MAICSEAATVLHIRVGIVIGSYRRNGMSRFRIGLTLYARLTRKQIRITDQKIGAQVSRKSQIHQIGEQRRE